MNLNNVFLTSNVQKKIRKCFKEILTIREVKFDDNKIHRIKDMQYKWDKALPIDLHEGRTVDITPNDLLGKSMFSNLCTTADNKHGSNGYDFLIDFLFNIMIEVYGISEEEALSEYKKMIKWRDSNKQTVDEWVKVSRGK